MCAQKIHLHALAFVSGLRTFMMRYLGVYICLFKAKKSTGIQTHIKYSNCIQIGGIWLFIIVDILHCSCASVFMWRTSECRVHDVRQISEHQLCCSVWCSVRALIGVKIILRSTMYLNILNNVIRWRVQNFTLLSVLSVALTFVACLLFRLNNKSSKN